MPRSNPKSIAADPQGDLINMFGPASFLAQQRLMMEALVAAGQKLVEGLQEVLTRSIQLQLALSHQMPAGAARMYPQAIASGDADRGAESFSAVSDATLAAIHKVMAASCKCPIDAISAFQQRISLAPGASRTAGPACGHQASTSQSRWS
jgi:hypothetical protein